MTGDRFVVGRSRTALDVYRSCSRAEKRELLEFFWRDRGPASPRVEVAARQYGPYAVAALVAVALEVIVLCAVVFPHSTTAGALLAGGAAATVASLVRAVSRWRELARRPRQ